MDNPTNYILLYLYISMLTHLSTCIQLFFACHYTFHSRPFFWDHFFSSPSTSSRFFFDEGLLVVNFLKIIFVLNLKIFLFWLQFGRTTFSGYTILGWQLFSVKSLNMFFLFASSFHCWYREYSCQDKYRTFVCHFFLFFQYPFRYLPLASAILLYISARSSFN